MKFHFGPRKKENTEQISDALVSTIAGSWYPDDPVDLRAMIAEKLKNAGGLGANKVPNLLILPHAGYDYSLATAMYGIKTVINAPYKRVIVMAPGHRAWVDNQFVVPESMAVATPLGEIELDLTAIERLRSRFSVVESDTVHRSEHAAQIQYPLLQYALKDFKIVPIIFSRIDGAFVNDAVAALKSIIDDETLIVISSDFTHFGRDFDFTGMYGDVRREVEALDMGAFEYIKKRDKDGFDRYIAEHQATICGAEVISLALALVPPEAVFELLHYETSSDRSKDYSRFVCYLAAAGYIKWRTNDDGLLTMDEKHLLLSMARRSIGYVFEANAFCPADFFVSEATPTLKKKMGCFVSLHDRKSHQLRGCIGEISAFRPLYQAVTMRAADAAFKDPRFYPLSADEFWQVQVEISVLTPERPVSSYREIVIGKHGMTLSKNGRFSVFLPQVAVEQEWDLETTLSHLALKAGLAADDWRNDATFTVFEAIVFQEN